MLLENVIQQDKSMCIFVLTQLPSLLLPCPSNSGMSKSFSFFRLLCGSLISDVLSQTELTRINSVGSVCLVLCSVRLLWHWRLVHLLVAEGPVRGGRGSALCCRAGQCAGLVCNQMVTI